MTPHTRLQPKAPTSIVRTSSRPDSATLIEQVKVSTMIKPKSASAIRSTGSSGRSDLVAAGPLDMGLGTRGQCFSSGKK